MGGIGGLIQFGVGFHHSMRHILNGFRNQIGSGKINIDQYFKQTTMNKLLNLAVTLIFSLSVSGQVPKEYIDSTPVDWSKVPKWAIGVPANITYQKKDTVRVIMLVCDTSSSRWVDSGYVNGLLVQLGEVHKGYSNMSVSWAYGYEVREKHNSIEGMIDPYFSFGTRYNDYYIHLEYLDEKKQPLVGMVVWMSKELR